MKVVLITQSIFFEDQDIDWNDCWLYCGPAFWIKGYPIIKRFGKNWIASRYIWFLFTGRDYYGKEIHHICRTRCCVNPLHLEELTSRYHRKYHNGIRNTKKKS